MCLWGYEQANIHWHNNVVSKVYISLLNQFTFHVQKYKFKRKYIAR